MAVSSDKRSHYLRQLAVIAAFSLVPIGVSAGPLSGTSKSIGKKTSTTSPPRGGGGSSSRTPRTDTRRGQTRSDGGYYGAGAGGYYGSRAAVGTGPHLRIKLKPTLNLFVGMQSVKGSDYAGDLRVSVHQGPVGFGFSGSSYVERFGGPMTLAAGSTSVGQGEDVKMDLWSLTLNARLLRDRRNDTALWLKGGVTGVSSTDFAQIFGPTVGVAMTHKLGEALGLRGSARQYWFEHDVSAREYRAEVTASHFSVGYRVLTFNVGEPLHGPTAGIRARF